MLARIRHKLRMIRYYSAPQHHTGWTRAMDAAFVASLLLAFPAVWICDLMIMHSAVATRINGMVFRIHGDRPVIVLADHPTATARRIGAGGEPIGNINLIISERHHGWPLVTTTVRERVRVDVDLRAEPRPRLDAQLAADDPLRQAITEALDLSVDSSDPAAEAARTALQAWQASTNRAPGEAIAVMRHRPAWFAAAGIWWMAIAAAGFIAIQLTRFGWFFVHGHVLARRAARKAEGRCLSCGYDLTGLEFRERCPECGSLIW